MTGKGDNFMSEVFWTSDRRFGFQRVGRVYNFYDLEHGYGFVQEFRSFREMQNYIDKVREKDAEEEKRSV